MRKRCVRKVYAKTNPIALAMEGASITPSSLLDGLRVRELAAIEAFRTGSATQQEWHDIDHMNSLCKAMALSGIGPEALEATELCWRELVHLKKRHEKTGRYTLTGSGLQAMRDVYKYHDLQRQSVARSEYERHINKLHGRIASKVAA